MNALERVSDPAWYQQSTQPYNSSLTASRTSQGCRVRKAYLSVGSALAHVPADKTVVSQAQTVGSESLSKLHEYVQREPLFKAMMIHPNPPPRVIILYSVY